MASLARCQANTVEFATKVCFALFTGPEVLVMGMKGEIMKHVAPQKLATYLVYR